MRCPDGITCSLLVGSKGEKVGSEIHKCSHVALSLGLVEAFLLGIARLVKAFLQIIIVNNVLHSGNV